MVSLRLHAALMLTTLCVFASSLRAQDTIPLGPDKKVHAYQLESVEIRGTTRMTKDQLVTELGLIAGTPLDDELVMTTRSKLLGLGLFKSAILIMRKGTRPGLAKLIVEVEDDSTVLTDWALGGELGVTASDSAASSVDTDSAPLDYRIGLIGRNILSSRHRGSLLIDFDSQGWVREAQLAYGLPRFAKEDVQFDAEIAAIDVTERYLNVLGFGGRGQGLWARSLTGLGEIQYGAAMYVNKKPRFAVPGFPSSVAGPKFAYFQETRLRGFFTGSGHLIAASLLLAPTRTQESVLELNLAKTVAFGRYLYFTVDAEALSVGIDGYSFRGEGRFDVPLGLSAPGEDQASLFLRLRGGHDIFNETNLVGSAAILGIRYHSSGFIAELAIKVTKSPDELAPTGLKSLGETPQ